MPVIAIGAWVVLCSVMTMVKSHQLAEVGVAIGVAILVTGHWPFRMRLEASPAGVALSGLFGARTLSWAAVAVVESTFTIAGYWVRCSDKDGRVTMWMTTSRLYPRMSWTIRRENEQLVRMLRAAPFD